jgi:pimeloyl-ACP methyl ester carboxylesterase
MRLTGIALLLLACRAPTPPAGPAAPASPGDAIVTEEVMIPGADAAVRLFVRNKRLRSGPDGRPKGVILYVQGSTYPASTTFDLALDGLSWMDDLARHGYDVYLLDLRGYGRSSRPPEMERPAEENPPIVTTAVALKDVSTAVDFIRGRHANQRVTLLGWSWGATIAAAYTVTNAEKVGKLILYGPQWVGTAAPALPPSGRLGAYRVTDAASMKTRWLAGVPEAKKEAQIPSGWFDAFAAATMATDPWGAKQTPPKLRAPNGTLQDRLEYWSVGKPYYDPAGIRVPTLVVMGEWDNEVPPPLQAELFHRLVNAPDKQLVEIGEGTHTMFMEKSRGQLFRAVRAFLEEPGPPP